MTTPIQEQEKSVQTRTMTDILCYLTKPAQQHYIQQLFADTPTIQYQLTTQLPDQGFYLTIDNQLLQLCLGGSPLTLSMDCLSLAIQQRISGSTKKLDLIKAVTGRSRSPLTILDMTAGLGLDTLTMASQGHQVTAIEKNPYVFMLLKQRLLRAKDIGLGNVIHNITLMFGDANKVAIPKGVFDVIYLDPMFPVRQKTAKTKKHMQLLKMLVPHNPAMDSLLLEYSRSLNSKKIIVKRHRLGQYLANQKPTSQIIGKSSRFDIYVNATS